MADEFLLKLCIEATVPFMILDIIEQGGIKDYHLEEARRYVDIIASEGDLILYRSKKKGQTARAFNALCRLLAIGAFFPGGIKFMGMHFEEKTGEALEHLLDSLLLEDFEKLKVAMEAEERRCQEEERGGGAHDEQN
jgi:hypothetical protein